MNTKLVGIFQSEDEVIRVIENLKAAGYKDNEISVIAKQNETVDSIKDATDVDTQATENVPNTVSGVALGGLFGGIGALMVELGVIAIPGIGPFLAAGPIAVTLAGLVAGGTLGGLVGALVDLGIDKEDAKEYETYIDRGDILVAVDTNDRIDRDHIIGCYYDNNSIIRDKYIR